MTADFYTALNTVKKVLAVDFACPETDFDNEGVFVYRARELPGRRKFPFREKSLGVATMGRGVVVSCSEERLRWAETILSRLSRNEICSAPAAALMNRYVSKEGQNMVGPDLKHVCAPDIFIPFTADKEIKITLVYDARQLEKYDYSQFPDCLGHNNNPNRVAAIARINGKIAGMASATADCSSLWQIGVDTLPDFRRRGIGKAVVSAVTKYILGQGAIPYYSTLESNIASRRIATSLGYRPAWVELYAREKMVKGGH
jgi:GNAT superfamily N-acetyltransferase